MAQQRQRSKHYNIVSTTKTYLQSALWRPSIQCVGSAELLCFRGASVF